MIVLGYIHNRLLANALIHIWTNYWFVQNLLMNKFYQYTLFMIHSEDH